uniref:Unannotated protein n=1 Tax=freshwater metagenome TaxID=449393 RepID=A0A6J5ZT19_9ZZZZ
MTVTKEGAGSGSVISSPAGIDCGATCSAAFNQGLELTLTATPAAGSTFTGWSFACPPNKAVKSVCRKIVTIPAGSGSNSSPTFTFSVDYDTYLVATFAKAAPAPSNLFTVSADGASTADLLTLVKVPGPGTAAQLGTFSGAASSRSARRVTACRASKKLSKAGRYKLSCKLTSAARSARRKGSIRVSLRTTFTPTGGAARTVTRTVTLKKTSSGVTG